MTDDELRHAISAIAGVSGVNLPASRVDQVLPAYKNYLEAIEAIRRVDLPLEAEPATAVTPVPVRGR
jgi:hypothetical protein